VRLGYRPPYDVEAMLGFFRTRAIEGWRPVTDLTLSRTLALDAHGRRWEGWLSMAFDEARVPGAAARERLAALACCRW
jgi:AraC family transcriptional regulator of adaptative response / DNA-3-methyladenine glycosylase II